MLYADLTIFFVNVVQIVAHFHIKYREKVYIFLEFESNQKAENTTAVTL